MSVQALGNWFLFVGQQWLSSLKVFLPKNFKLFILVTLNAWWQATKTFFAHFWWLLIVFLFLNTHEMYFFIAQILQPFLAKDNQLLLFFQRMGTQIGFAEFFLPLSFYSINLFGFALNLWKIVEFLPYFLMFLAIRPSVNRKTYRYFFSYLWQYILFFICLSIIGFLDKKFFLHFFPTTIWELVSLFSFLFEDIIDLLTTSPIFVFTVFFFLDSKGGVTDLIMSFWRGLKMAFYGYPFALISVFLFRYIFLWSLFTLPFLSYIFNISYVISFVLSWSIYLLYFSWLNTFYIKRAHEDYDIYFK